MPLSDNALTVEDNVKLAVDTTTLQRYINAASTIVENHCNTKFKEDSYSEKLKPKGEKYLSVNYWNIESVDSITFDGEIIDAEDYTILNNRGMLYAPGGWPDANDYLLDITLTAGFVLPKDETTENPRTLPEDIESACIVMCQELYKLEQSGGDVSRKTRGGVSTSYFDRKGLPDAVRYLLSGWRFRPV